jgi:predicted DNA-binding transcriptional regulator AlpA
MSTTQTTARDNAAIIASLPPEMPKSAWLTIDQVLLFFPFSRAHIYRMIAAGEFPKPRKSGRLSTWHTRDLRQLLDRGPSQRSRRVKRATS